MRARSTSVSHRLVRTTEFATTSSTIISVNVRPSLARPVTVPSVSLIHVKFLRVFTTALVIQRPTALQLTKTDSSTPDSLATVPLATKENYVRFRLTCVPRTLARIREAVECLKRLPMSIDAIAIHFLRAKIARFFTILAVTYRVPIMELVSQLQVGLNANAALAGKD